jgi:hypothetical protein
VRRRKRRRRRTWRLKKTTSLSLYLSLSALCAYYIAQPEGRGGMIVLIDRRWRFFVVRATNKNEKNAKK